MKKRLIIFLAFSIFSMFGLIAEDKGQQAKKNSTLVVTGYIVSKGNVPFTFPAIVTEDGDEYVFKFTDRQKKKLLKLQGRSIRFTLLVKEDGVMVLKKYKVLK